MWLRVIPSKLGKFPSISHYIFLKKKLSNLIIDLSL